MGSKGEGVVEYLCYHIWGEALVRLNSDLFYFLSSSVS